MNRFQVAYSSWLKSRDMGVPVLPALRLCWFIIRAGKYGAALWAVKYPTKP